MLNIPSRPFWQEQKSYGYPLLKDLYAIPSVAITTVIMAYSGLFGIYPILLFYILWLSRVLYKGRLIVNPSSDIFMPLVFASFCIFSIFWSDYPEVTIRAGLEFLSMIVCTIIISRIVSMEAFIKGMIAGTCLVLISTLISGNYGKDSFSGDYSLIGLFGSKNQVGLFAEIGIYASILYFFTKAGLWQKIFYSVFPSLLFIVCLYMSRSATSVVTLAAVLIITYTAYLITKLAPHRRKHAFIAAIFFGILIVGSGLYLGEEDTLLHVMGKDTTLTGRTYLWAQGLKVGLEDPVLGHGYSAFWVPGQLEAERYWFEFYIFARSGFHFHNLFIQTFVDLGAVGLVLMCFIILANCYKSFRYLFENGNGLKAIFCLGISFLFLSRAFVEVDFLGPFGIGQILFFSILPRLASREFLPGGEDIAAPFNKFSGKTAHEIQ